MSPLEQHIVALCVCVDGLWAAYFMNQLDRIILRNRDCDDFVNQVNNIINEPKF